MAEFYMVTLYKDRPFSPPDVLQEVCIGIAAVDQFFGDHVPDMKFGDEERDRVRQSLMKNIPNYMSSRENLNTPGIFQRGWHNSDVRYRVQVMQIPDAQGLFNAGDLSDLCQLVQDVLKNARGIHQMDWDVVNRMSARLAPYSRKVNDDGR